jgi:hypothetical protein
MAALSYMQRRVSGTYEFRKRLPEVLAGKDVPAHMRAAFGDLINTKTGCFKREFVRSLQTKDIKQAIEHRILDVIQGHSPRSVAEGYGEVTIKTQATAIAKLPRYKV